MDEKTMICIYANMCIEKWKNYTLANHNVVYNRIRKINRAVELFNENLLTFKETMKIINENS